MDRQTDTTENITLPQLRWWVVINPGTPTAIELQPVDDHLSLPLQNFPDAVDPESLRFRFQ